MRYFLHVNNMKYGGTEKSTTYTGLMYLASVLVEIMQRNGSRICI